MKQQLQLYHIYIAINFPNISLSLLLLLKFLLLKICNKLILNLKKIKINKFYELP